MKTITLIAALFFAMTARADSATDIFTFNPGDWPVTFSLPTSFAPVAPTFDGAGDSYYGFGAVAEGSLILNPIFETLANGGEKLSVELDWTASLPAPFDVIFDNAGEFANFQQPIFNVTNSDLSSFNTGNFDGGVLTIVDPVAVTPEHSTLLLLLTGLCLVVPLLWGKFVRAGEDDR